jgi:hypothetical protein
MTDCYIKSKPELSKHISLKDFKNYYWLKAELVIFCKKEGLSTFGLKENLLKRVEKYISTGEKLNAIKNDTTKQRDSDKKITLNTSVIHYKNDAVTRDFFLEQIGSHFRFNDYLRQFCSKTSEENSKFTYGDLVKGWLMAEENKKNLGKKYKIGNQFEYNKFIRDFFIHGKGKTRQAAIEA